MSKPIYPDLSGRARIRTATTLTLPPQPPLSSTVLKNVEAVLTKSTALSSSSNYTFDVEREVLARARVREGTTAKENSIELDLTGVQVERFDCTSR